MRCFQQRNDVPDLVQQIETRNTKTACLNHIDIGSIKENDIRIIRNNIGQLGSVWMHMVACPCIYVDVVFIHDNRQWLAYMTMGNGWGVGSPLQTVLTYVILVLVGATVEVALAMAVEAGGVELVAAVEVELLLIVPLPLPLPLPALPL